MGDFTRRTFKTWAVCQVVYALAIAWVVIVHVPWKTPVANILALVYAALHVGGALGLWRGERWGWRLSLSAGLLGLVAAVGVTAALLASWAYLRSVFGDFGEGASLAALLFASVALQLLGLFPALQVRAMLRREVRADMGAKRGLVGALFGLLSVPLVLMAVVWSTYSMHPLPPVSEAGRQQALEALRAALDEEPVDEVSLRELEGLPAGRGALRVSLWHHGRAVARVEGEGDELAQAVGAAARALREEELDEEARREGRLKIDRVVATAPVLSEWSTVLSLSVNPGLDGLRRCAEGRCKVLLPDDLIRGQRFGVAPLVPGIREIRLGLDVERVVPELELEGGRLERIRTEGWVEHEGRAVEVVRGNTLDAATGPEAWRDAAIAGGDFILRQIRRDGRFHYIYRPLSDRHRGRSYSIPRHSGTVYALALLYGETKQARFRRGAERAIEWLATKIPERCGAAEGACVVRSRRAQLGASALSAVGMLEYQRRTGDERYAETAQRLIRFLRYMQRDDGDFHHVYRPRDERIDPEPRMMFASEEAALALVMAHEVLGDEEALTSAERALDFLTGPKYEDTFLGRFIYGADHWTCIAAEEAYPRLDSRQYLDFCRGYASFIRRIQYQPGQWNNSDFTGHYGFGALMVPQAPAAAGFTEAIISTHDLARHHGEDDAVLGEQVSLALDALTRDQVRSSNAYLMRRPRRAVGGIRRSLVENEIRIDFTQHAASALIRGAVSLGRQRSAPST